MQVTSMTVTEEGKMYALNNGDSILLKNSTGFTGKPLQYWVYCFADGMRYSARTGMHSRRTVLPAAAAVARFEAAK